MPRLLCLGLGWLAEAVADGAAAAGWAVAGTARRPERRAALSARGWQALPWEAAAAWIPASEAILVSVPPGPDGRCPALAAFAGALASHPGLRWLGYLSSTGVYGQRYGAWTDETALLAGDPRRRATEASWSGLAAAGRLPLHRFRLAGLYGPGRNALATARAGRARRVVKPGLVVNRIHRDDAAAAILASLARPRPGALWDLADGRPLPPQRAIEEACRLLGLPLPPAEPWRPGLLPPPAEAAYATSLRIAGVRVRQELGLSWRHASVLQGLRALRAAGEAGAATT